jgi:hypothetical protein
VEITFPLEIDITNPADMPDLSRLQTSSSLKKRKGPLPAIRRGLFE